MSKTPDVVAAEILAKLAVTAPGFSLEKGTPERKIVDAVAESLSEAYIDQYLVGSLMDLESKVGLELEQWVGIFGFGRLQGRKATGVVRVELKNANIQDITVPKSSSFYTRQTLPSTGSAMFFQSTETVIIPGGSYVADVPVECTVVGTAGNVPPDSIVYVGDIIGATSATNLQAFTGGVDIETDDELRQRFKDTFLRNISGTEDFYLGLCYQNKHVSKAACFGPIRKYSTQIAADGDVDLAPYINLDVKYAWPGDGHVHAFKDLGQDSEEFYKVNEDFSWLAGQDPRFVWNPAGAIPQGQIVDLEFEYTTRSSRNDPLLGVTNKIDLFVNGSDNYVITERTLIDNSIRLTDVATDRLYRKNFTRVGPARLRAASSLTNATASAITVSKTDNVYTVTLTNKPTGGYFTLSYGGQTTTPLVYNAAPSAVQAALRTMSAVGSTGATVTAATDATTGSIVPSKYVITMTVSSSTLTAAVSTPLTNATASQAVVKGTAVTLTNTPTGGTYTLSYGSQTTGALAYNASTTAVQAALEALSTVGSGNVQVVGTPTSYVVKFGPETKVPINNNRFMRLGSTPVVSFPSILVVNGTTYTEGVHYHLLRLAPENSPQPNATALMAGSVYETVGIEWESTGPAPTSPATTVPVTVTYTYNRVPELLQAMMTTNKQVTTDVMVHQASYAYIKVHLWVEYNRNLVVSTVNNAIEERLRAYFDSQPYGSWLEVSDMMLSIRQVLGVDNVGLTVSDDVWVGGGDDHGIQVFADSSDTVPIATHDEDFKLADNQLPNFLTAVIYRRANR